MENKKKIMIGILSVLVCIMAVGYALLAQELTINGSASIDSTWRVEITNITSKDVVGDAINKVDPSYTATTANFSAGFTQPGDSITYDITVTNKGTLDAVVESITVNKGDNPAITYTTSGLKRGDKLAKNNGTNTLTIKVDYDSSVTTQPTSTTNNITVTINYQQDLGQVVVYDYEVGDTITYNGTTWRVIKNSPSNEDYVTLLKEALLTAEEIGNAYSYKTSNGVAQPSMAYYWSNECHGRVTYGTTTYTDAVGDSGCRGHNDYAGSKIKQAVNAYMSRYLQSSKLKSVDGYKIRLITRDEIIENLGWNSGSVANWVYGSNVGAYWTMTAPTTSGNSDSWSVFCVETYKYMGPYEVNHFRGVRSVINLLKTAIE